MHAMTSTARKFGRAVRTGAAAAVLSALMITLAASPASAQAQSDPNPGALTVTASFDFPSIYYFRGIRQETDPGLTFFPAVDVGIALSLSLIHI